MFKSLIKDAEIIRFILVGMVNTIFGYSCYAFFLFIGMHYSIAVFFATILGVFFNFKTFGKFVFKVDKNVLIFKFIVVYFVIYFVNVFAIKIFTFLGYDLYVSGVFSIIIVAVCSYILNKNIVFNKGV
jgi:putative flippase GtrA